MDKKYISSTGKIMRRLGKRPTIINVENNRRALVFACCCLLVIIAILLNSGSAFEYTTDKPAEGYVCVPESDEVITQKIPSGSRVLKGICIRFDPLEQINTGEIEVRFYKNDDEIKSWIIQASELTYDQYRQFRFGKRVIVKEDDECRFTVSERYARTDEAANQTGICMSGTVGIDESADSDTVDGIVYHTDIDNSGTRDAEYEPEERAVCYQLKIEDTAMRNRVMVPFIFLFILICAAGGLLIDFRMIRLQKMFIATLIVAVFAGTSATGFMQNIVRNIAVYDFRDEDVMWKLDPGETLESVVYADRCDFSAVEYSISNSTNRSTSMHVEFKKTDEEEAYIDKDISSLDLLSGGPNDAKVRISAADTTAVEKFPMGTYILSVTNTDEDKKLRISMVESLSESVAENSVSGSGQEEERGYETLDSEDMADDYSEIDQEKEAQMCLNYALIRTSDLGYRIAGAVYLLLVIYILALIALITRRSATAERFFLVSAVPLGIIYLILVLPWSPPDAGSHILASYRLSNIMLGSEKGDEWKARAEDAAYFPEDWMTAKDKLGIYFPCMEEYGGTFLRSRYHEEINTEISEEEGSDSEIVGVGVGRLNPDENGMVQVFEDVKMEYYSLLSYAPQVLGLVLGRLFGLGAVATIYLGRILILIAYIAACEHAVRIVPVGKSIFACTALLPMSMSIASSYSYDAIVTISTTCLIASVLAAYYSPEKKRYFVESIAWAFLVGASKGGGYLILLPLVLMLFAKPQIKYGNEFHETVEQRRVQFEAYRKGLKRAAIIVLAGIVSVLLFDFILAPGNSFQFGEVGTGKLSFSFALFHPIRYLQMLFGTFLNNSNILLFTRIAWTEETIPAFFSAGLLCIIIIWAVFEKDDLFLRSRDRKVFLLILLMGFVLTPAMLLSWTREYSSVINGVQGRYFLPLLPVMGLVLTKFRLSRCTACSEQEEAAIRRKCMTWFCTISCVSVYAILCLYLTR